MIGTADWDEASHTVSEAYFPHRLIPAERGSTAERVSVNGANLGPVRIAKIGWGSPVVIETAHEGGVAVNLPLSGAMTSRVGGRDLRATTLRATVYPANTAVTISEWPANCRILGVRFEHAYLARESQRLFARPLSLPSEFALDDTLRKRWLGLVRSIIRNPFHHPLVEEQLAGALTAALLVETMPRDESYLPSCPHALRKVIEKLHEEPGHAWTAADMAATAGVGIRQLQEGFRAHLDTSPHAYLTSIRLRKARADLESPHEGDTVTDIAMRNGLVHVGRFAAAYQRAYGEAPSETLRRALGR